MENAVGTERIEEDMGAMKLTDAELEEFKKGLTLYPAYFDGRKSVREGRRVPKSLAVNCDLKANGIPITAWHLASACEQLGLPCILEDGKRYTRDYWGYGRIRIKFNKQTGHRHPVHGHLKNSNAFILLTKPTT